MVRSRFGSALLPLSLLLISAPAAIHARPPAAPARISVTAPAAAPRRLPQVDLQPQRPALSFARSGPIPDYAPIEGIRVHHTLREVSPGLWYTLDTLLGAALEISDYDGVDVEDGPDRGMVWMRDYHPLYLRRGDAPSVEVSYLAPNVNRSGWRPDQAAPKGARLPLIHENGNLISVGDHVFLSDIIITDNQGAYEGDHLTAGGLRAFSEAEIREQLSTILERPASHVHIVPAMPGEPTGHVDLFMLPLGPRRLMIPVIRDEALALSSAPTEGAEAQRFLDEQARLIAGMGFEVIRLPMMPPYYVSDDEEEEAASLAFASPANSLLLAYAGRQMIVVPSFGYGQGHSKAWMAMSDRYARRWAESFAAEGWLPYLVDASELVPLQGFFRCLTAPIH